MHIQDNTTSIPNKPSALSSRATDMILAKPPKVYSLMHAADIGDRSVKFTYDGITEDQVKDLASYIQFKAERLFDEYASLDNSTIVEFLALCGATMIDKNQLNEHSCLVGIDTYNEREDRICGSNWLTENFDRFDEKYDDTATTFLKSKVVGKNWHKDMI